MAGPVAVAAAGTRAASSKHGKLILLAIVVGLLSVIMAPLMLPVGIGAVLAISPPAETGTPTPGTPGTPSVDLSNIGGCAPKCAGKDGPQTGLSVKATIELALSEVGTSRPTGWNAPGECLVSVRRWLHHGGGNFAGGGVVSGYVNSPALNVTDGSLRPGDIIQYTSNGFEDMFGVGVHTYMVLQVHPDGTHDLVESNNPGGSGLVGRRDNMKPEPPNGWHAKVWRFAASPDL